MEKEVQVVWLHYKPCTSHRRPLFSQELGYGELLGMEKPYCAWPEGSREAIGRGPDTKNSCKKFEGGRQATSAKPETTPHCKIRRYSFLFT